MGVMNNKLLNCTLLTAWAIWKSTSGGLLKKQERRKNILLFTKVSYIHRLLLDIIAL
jgi:hypothetical protein